VESARRRVFRYYALVPHAYRFTPSRGSAATRAARPRERWKFTRKSAATTWRYGAAGVNASDQGAMPAAP